MAESQSSESPAGEFDPDQPEISPAIDSTKISRFKRGVSGLSSLRKKTTHGRSSRSAASSRSSISATTYNPREADLSIGIGPILQDKRFWRVARTLTTFVAGSISDKYGGDGTMTSSERSRRRARRMTRTLLEMGPTFIKLGQFLSVRRDILSTEMAEELALLQDKVPPFEIDEVKAIIERDLGGPPDKLFAHFEENTIASASIGQVHRATLHDGTRVVIKVQRPDLAIRFNQDLGYMRMVVKLGMALRPSGEWDSWLKLSDEFGRTLFRELDYLQEGKNADRLRQILKDHDEIRVPRVFWKHTGKRVLTLEYIPGTKVDNLEALRNSGMDLIDIGNKLVSCYLDQVLLHGFFHADPHAGNMAIDEYGNVVLYDFGMIGEISEEQREAITGCIAAVIKRDTDELVKHLKVLEIVRDEAGIEPIKRAIAPFIDYYAGTRIMDLDFSHLEDDIDQVAAERALRMPPNLAYLLRAGSSVEGIARTLHPDFSFVDAAKPSMRKWVMQRPEQAAKVLKLMGGDYAGMIKAAWQRLVNNKASEGGEFLESTRIVRPEKETQKERQPELQQQQTEVKKEDQDGPELEEVKRRVNELEMQVEVERKNRVHLVADSLWFLSFALLFVGASLLPEIKGYAPYFLIGNGLMVAKQIRHVIRSLRERGQPAKSNGTRRQRR